MSEKQAARLLVACIRALKGHVDRSSRLDTAEAMLRAIGGVHARRVWQIVDLYGYLTATGAGIGDDYNSDALLARSLALRHYGVDLLAI